MIHWYKDSSLFILFVFSPPTISPCKLMIVHPSVTVNVRLFQCILALEEYPKEKMKRKYTFIDYNFNLQIHQFLFSILSLSHSVRLFICAVFIKVFYFCMLQAHCYHYMCTFLYNHFLNTKSEMRY